MRMGHWFKLAVVGLIVVSFPLSAGAQQTKTESFQLSGWGSHLITPAEYDGQIIGGSLMPGTFSIDIDDTGWPVDNPATPNINERWEHVLATYYTYDNSTPGAEQWVAYFPPISQITPVVTWQFYTGPDKIGGVMRLILSIADNFGGNPDGIPQTDEILHQTVATNMTSHIEQSTGEFFGFCGGGSANGTTDGFELSQPFVFTINTGSLLLRDFGCQVANEETTWGAVKSIYAE